jgi:hypothetical protein
MRGRENVSFINDGGPALVLPLARVRVVEVSERGHPRPRVRRDHVLADAEHEPAVAVEFAGYRAAFYHCKSLDKNFYGIL